MRNIKLLLLIMASLWLIATQPLLAVEQKGEAPLENTTSRGIVHINSISKTSSSDGADVSFHRLLNWSGVIHMVMLNDRAGEQPLLLKFGELNEPAYDIYVDGAVSDSRTREELEQGIEITLPAASLLEDEPIIQAIMEGSASLIRELQSPKDPDSRLALAILANVRMWSQTAQARIRNSGGAYVILTPTTLVLSTPLGWTRPSAESVRSDTSKYWKAIQDQRDILQISINNSDLRNRAISTLTPTEIAADLTSDDPSAIKLLVHNRSEAVLTGNLSLEGAEWTQTCKSVEINELPRNGVFESIFNLDGLDITDREQLTVSLQIKVGKAEFSKFADVTEATSKKEQLGPTAQE